MEFPRLSYRPTLDPDSINQSLAELLVPGPLSDGDLNSRLDRLAGRFRLYAALSPHGLWAPGLVISREMRLAAEFYLPLEEIARAIHRLLVLSLKVDRSPPAPVFDRYASWLDVIQSLYPLARDVNPAFLLRLLMSDSSFRCRFLFALSLPRHYGGRFNRYPEQAAFLRNWLEHSRLTGRMVRCLDAACGSGEGTYGLALLLRCTGFAPEQLTVHGATIEPLELFAAAHGWFPHDPVRQEAFRRHIDRLFTDATAEQMAFFREDLAGGQFPPREGYDIILCNGLLGGPLMNSRDSLEKAVESLCARLRPGGLLLVADRFHGGWKKRVPGDGLKRMLAGYGLKTLAGGEGVAGVKPGRG